jgi:hypothetical protein
MVNRVDFGVDNLHVSSAVHADSHRVSDLAIDNMAYLEKMVKRIDFGVDEEHVSAAVHVDSTASENPSPIRMSFSKPTRKSGSNQIANSMSAGNNFHHDTASSFLHRFFVVEIFWF